jgi:photosystem II stability/assembly factor-like uncharacterized protein
MSVTRLGKFIASLGLAGFFAFAGVPPAAAQQQPVFESEHEQEYRHQAFWSTHRDSQGRVRPDLWRIGIQNFLMMKAAQQPWLSLPQASDWLQIGPQPLRIDKNQNYQGKGPDSGEVVDIAIDPSGASDQTIYIATNDGGIWRTTDGGMTWAQRTDTGCPDAMTNCPSLSMGAVVISPQGTIFGGTGNPFDGGRLFTHGVGIYRSTDGGTSWTILPSHLFDNLHINRIVFATPLGLAQRMLVATNAGLYCSVDNGDHFGRPPDFMDGMPVLAGKITDLKVDSPGGPSLAVATYAAASGTGIFRSWNATFTDATNLFSNHGAPPPGSYADVTLAVSTKPTPQRLYANVAKDAKNYLGLYRSDDRGNSWTDKSAWFLPTTCQCDYDLTIGVDPQDKDRVYVGFQELWLSTNGGFSFSLVTSDQVHWDHHALYFSPSSHWGSPPTRVWVGEDGGIASSRDGGATWDNLNETIATNLFKHIDIGRNTTGNIAYTYGGTQDTGTIERRPGFSNNDWHLGIDGDGSGVGVDPFTPTTAYGIDDGSYMNTTDGGDTWVFPGALPSAWRYAIDPNNSSNVFAVTSTNSGFQPGPDLYRSTDKGKSFAKVYSDSGISIRSIANTSLNSDLIWLGMEDGSLRRCTGALSLLACAGIRNGLPARPVGGISIILADPKGVGKDRVIAVYEGMAGGHAFYTADSGANWRDISNTLPDLPTHSVYGSAAISNDAGVMFTDDLGSHWRVLGGRLPTVDSTQLAGGECPPVLRLGTYGRSVWELNPSSEVGFYDSGPVNGMVAGWPIGLGAWVSDSFRATGSSMQGVTFAVWVPHTVPPTIPLFVGWRVTDKPDSGSLCAEGNAVLAPTFLFTNPEDFDVYSVKFDTPSPVPLNVGATYFLTLHDLITNMAPFGLWDQNSGLLCMGSGVDLDGIGANCPSYGYYPMGGIPSETFQITTAP